MSGGDGPGAPVELAPAGLAPAGLAPAGLAPVELAPAGLAPAGLAPAELAVGVHVLFTSRHGGVSAAPYDTLNLSGAVGDDAGAVAANRRRAAQACGLGAGRLAWMRQVHGSAVRYAASGDDAGPPASGDDAGAAASGDDAGAPASGDRAGPAEPEADASFTDVTGLALGVLVADCAPVLLADPRARIVGAAHAGREGMAAGVVTELITAMSAAGADPARMHAVIGPHICGGCYEVPAALRDRVARQVPESACVTRRGTPGIDVGAGVEAQLARAGVRTVTRDPRCTAETPGLYSYRRDGRTGRMAGFVWLAP